MRRLRAWLNNIPLLGKFILILFTSMALVCLVALLVTRVPYAAYDDQLYKSSAQMTTLFADKIQSELDDIENLSFRILADNALQESLSVMKEKSPGTTAWVTANSAVGNRVSYFSLWFNSAITLQLRTTGGAVFTQAFGHLSSVLPSQTDAAELMARASGHMGRAVWLIEPEEDSARVFLAREIREMKDFTLDPLATMLIEVDVRGTVERYRRSLGQLGSPLRCAIYAPKTDGAPLCLYASDLTSRRLGPDPDGIPDDGYAFMRLDGQDTLCVRFTAPNGWKYVTLVDYGGIRANVAGSERFTLVSMLGTLLLALLLGAAMISSVVGHLQALVSKFDAFALTGHPAPEADDPYQARRDEIGRLHRHFDKMTRDWDRMTKDNMEKQRLLQETQMQQLRAQVRPHFLYNTLESIYCLAIESGNEHIATMTHALGKMLRVSLDMKRDVVTLSEDLDTTRQYLSIQLIRYGSRLQVAWDVPEELLACPIPAMTLQPLVENAVHHAAEEMLDTCVIHISARQLDGGDVEVIVADNGPGMDEDILTKLESGVVKPEGMGIGMRNIHRRVQYCFSNRYGLRVKSEPGNTQVSVLLPGSGWSGR